MDSARTSPMSASFIALLVMRSKHTNTSKNSKEKLEEISTTQFTEVQRKNSPIPLWPSKRSITICQERLAEHTRFEILSVSLNLTRITTSPFYSLQNSHRPPLFPQDNPNSLPKAKVTDAKPQLSCFIHISLDSYID